MLGQHSVDAGAFVGGERDPRRAMHVEEMWTGREMDYYTTAPGVQLYTGNWLDGSLVGKRGRFYLH